MDSDFVNFLLPNSKKDIYYLYNKLNFHLYFINKLYKDMNFITSSDFINSGLPTSNDLSTYEIDFCILTVEEFYIKPALTDTHYTELLADRTSPLVKGGTIDNKVYAGLQQAMYHLVFAWMLVNNYRITRYSSVEKNSEYSKSPDNDALELLARRHWAIGTAFVKEVQEFYDLDDMRTNDIFETLLY